MITLLCVDDSKEVQMIVARTFLHVAKVLSAETLAEAYSILQKGQVDFLLLDLSMPDGDGFEFFIKISEDKNFTDIPVIVLTSHNQIQNKVMAFHLGAEDYIVKPFDPAELKVRVETRFKRHQLGRDNDSKIHAGNLTINHLEQKVLINSGAESEDVVLTSTEFKILSYLAKHKDQVMSREQIIGFVWKQNFNISDRTIDSHISRVRKKILRSDHTIIAVQNVGYKFTAQKVISAKPA